jgi:CubicO group peptidase (beta-lactamase class C family)
MSGLVPQDRKPDDTLATLMPRYAALPLLFQPGTKWSYSAIAGPGILARIVEIVSGQNYEQYLRARLFDPLGMKDTSHFPTDAQRPRVVTLYQKKGNKFIPTENPGFFSSKTYFSGSAGLVTTAEDYMQFAQLLVRAEFPRREFRKDPPFFDGDRQSVAEKRCCLVFSPCHCCARGRVTSLYNTTAKSTIPARNVQNSSLCCCS